MNTAGFPDLGPAELPLDGVLSADQLDVLWRKLERHSVAYADALDRARSAIPGRSSGGDTASRAFEVAVALAALSGGLEPRGHRSVEEERASLVVDPRLAALIGD